MSLGFQWAGFDVVAAFDKNPRCVSSYRANFPEATAVEADLASTSGSDIRRLGKLGRKHVDVLFGGPPCGGFSVAGQRDPSDPRNKLLLHFAELITELRPSYFVVENVRGLVIGDAIKVLKKFRKIVDKAGYETLWPVKVLNAADYGVPQRRERVIVLGALKTLTIPSYPLPSTPESSRTRPTVGQAIRDLATIDSNKDDLAGDHYLGPLGHPSAYARMLRASRADSQTRDAARGRPSFLTGCLRATHTLKSIRRFKNTSPGTCEPISRCYRLEYDGLARTIRAGTDEEHGKFTAVRPLHPEHPRCITVREAARLHSLPDWFTFHPTNWHGFMQIGNAVPPLLAKAVAGSVLANIS